MRTSADSAGSSKAAAIAVGAAVLVAIVAGPAGAQQKADSGAESEAKRQSQQESGAEEPEQARTIRIAEHDATLYRPEGWVRRKPAGRALVTLGAAGDPGVQIEVRVSTSIDRQRRDNFFNSFHSTLKEAGFVEHDLQPKATFGGRTGEWTEYEGSANGGEFRLIVWQLFEEDDAWMFIAFFPERRRNKYLSDYKAILESLSFGE